jgi:hypothetical protein
MNNFFYLLRQWAEVWPLLIPLSIFIIFKPKQFEAKTIFTFVIASFLISGISVVTWLYGKTLPNWLKNSNNTFYNLNSVLRTIVLGWYMLRLKQLKHYKYPYYILPVYAILLVTNFLIWESFAEFSSHLFAAESIVLLLFCLTYLLSAILDDEEQISFRNPAFLICSAISLYEALNFFIYLFLFELSLSNHELGMMTMRISQYSFILFGALLGLGLYQYARFDKRKGKRQSISQIFFSL